MALENARLYQASERRALQLQALTMVAGTITSSLQREELISSLLDQLKLVLPYDTATLWLRSAESLRWLPRPVFRITSCASIFPLPCRTARFSM